MADAPPGALSGVLVLDLSTRLSGAFCARLMGDLGADVVLAEGPEGHPLRAEPPFLHDVDGPERSLLHAYANLNKRSIDAPLDDPRTSDLIAEADVVLASDAPTVGRVRRHARGDAVLVAVTPHGLTGPRASAPGNDLTAYALSGWAAMNGLQGQPPLKGSANQVGYLAGVIALVGATAALHERRASRQGQEVDVSETEALTLTAGPTLLSAAYEGRSPERHISDVFGGPVPAEDGYVSATFSRAHFWRDAMNALGLEELAEDPRYLDPWSRRKYRAELAPMIEARLVARDRWGLFEHLSLLRCVCGVVLDMRDLDQNEHLQDRGFFVETEQDDAVYRVPGAPFKMSETPWSLRCRAPRLGEHTAELCRGWRPRGDA